MEPVRSTAAWIATALQKDHLQVVIRTRLEALCRLVGSLAVKCWDVQRGLWKELSDGDRILNFNFKPNSVSVTQFLPKDPTTGCPMSYVFVTMTNDQMTKWSVGHGSFDRYI